jgi:hypothetical protein
MGAAVLSLSLAARPAIAQSHHAFRATLVPDGEAVGNLADARVEIARWDSPSRPVIRYRDAEIELESPVDLGDRETRIAIGIGERATLAGTGAWSITMEPGTWAPLRGRDGGGTRIALPRGMPVAEAQIARSVRGAQGVPQRAFEHREVGEGWTWVCAAGLVVRATPAADAPTLPVPERTHVRWGPTRSGTTAAHLFFDGFVVHAWLAGAPPRCAGGIGDAGGGSGCGDGITHGIAVVVPAGTPLWASEASAAPFARTRADLVALEMLDTPPAQACVSGACRRSPPEPTGSSRFLFHHDGPGSSWVLEAWVRIPAETLVRPPDARGDFGSCTAGPWDWPE